MQEDLSTAYREAMAACDEARNAAVAAGFAADSILARSDLWITLHPIQYRRLRRVMLDAHGVLVEKRAAMVAATARYWTLRNGQSERV